MEYGKKQPKTINMRIKHCRTWIVARKLKNVENDTNTLYDLKYGKKH
jgi:hypothetical protein